MVAVCEQYGFDMVCVETWRALAGFGAYMAIIALLAGYLSIGIRTRRRSMSIYGRFIIVLAVVQWINFVVSL